MASKAFGTNLHDLIKTIEDASDLRLKEIGRQVAQQLRSFRELQELSQSDLAKLLATGQSRISQMEDPDYAKLSLSSLAKAAVCLECDLIVELRKKGSIEVSPAVSHLSRIVIDTLHENSDRLVEAITEKPSVVAEDVRQYDVPKNARQQDNILNPGVGRRKWVA